MGADLEHINISKMSVRDKYAKLRSRHIITWLQKKPLGMEESFLQLNVATFLY